MDNLNTPYPFTMRLLNDDRELFEQVRALMGVRSVAEAIRRLMREYLERQSQQVQS